MLDVASTKLRDVAVTVLAEASPEPSVTLCFFTRSAVPLKPLGTAAAGYRVSVNGICESVRVTTFSVVISVLLESKIAR